MCTVTLSYDKENKQAVKQQTAPLSMENIAFDKRERHLIETAHSLTAAEIDELKNKELMTIEESQMLLLRMVEDEYHRPCNMS